MQHFSIQRRIQGEILILIINGQLDALTAEKLLLELDYISEHQMKFIVLNLEQVPLVDSAGIGAIVSILKKTRSMSGNTVLVNVDAQPMEVFKIVNLPKAMQILGSVDAGITYFTSATAECNGARQ